MSETEVSSTEQTLERYAHFLQRTKEMGVVGHRGGLKATRDLLQMYLSDVLTIPVNIAGLPGISLPCGFSQGPDGSRLPIGLQILAKPFDEPTLFRAAYAYEQATDWHKQHPEL